MPCVRPNNTYVLHRTRHRHRQRETQRYNTVFRVPGVMLDTFFANFRAVRASIL